MGSIKYIHPCGFQLKSWATVFGTIQLAVSSSLMAMLAFVFAGVFSITHLGMDFVSKEGKQTYECFRNCVGIVFINCLGCFVCGLFLILTARKRSSKHFVDAKILFVWIVFVVGSSLCDATLLWKYCSVEYALTFTVFCICIYPFPLVIVGFFARERYQEGVRWEMQNRNYEDKLLHESRHNYMNTDILQI